MKKNTTQPGRLRAGIPKTVGLNSHRKSFSPNVSTNYKLLLEIYCINKKEADMKKELKPHSVIRRRSPARTIKKPSFSVTTTVISFFHESLLLLKKMKPGIAMATVRE